jgi:uncharacterized membrane protein YgcG
VRAQLSEFIAQHALPKGMGTVYYLLTPPGVAVCLDKGGVETGQCSDFAGTFQELEEEEDERRKDEEEELTFVPSEQYESYKRSFCSYHSAIGEGAETILFGMIPWTAGGAGDPHLAVVDQTSDYPCQDGGFEPFTKPGGELQEAERPKPKTPLEEEEFAKKNAKEKREIEEAEELGLNKAHIQEPNSLAESFGADGGHDAGLADLIINQIAVQQQNIVTDPLLNGWQDSGGKELMDECRNSFFLKRGGSANATPDTRAGTLFNQVFGGGSYYLNDTFNMAALRLPYPGVPCLNGVNLIPAFTSPNTVNANEIVGLDGMESDVELNSTISYPAKTTTYATFTWNFGDGSPEVSGFAPGASSENSPSTSPCTAPWLAPCAASTFHSYTYGGTYQVTLTVRDTGGHVASVSHPITVVGPAPPSAAGSGSGSVASSGSSTGSSTSSGAGTTSGGGRRTPAATAAIVSRSLRRALRGGIVVRYSLNEALVGRLEVMLPTSVARRLHIGGGGAVGLPAGTPPQTIIARSVLVAARGGTGTLTIHVGSKTASRLHRLHTASLLLRILLHNTSGGNVVVIAPATLVG